MTIFNGRNENTVKESLANIFNLSSDTLNSFNNHFMYHYFYLNQDNDRAPVDVFAEEILFTDFDNLKFDYINIFHLTTQDNQLSDLRTFGLIDLISTLKKETIQKRYLNNKNIKFLFEDNIILKYNNREFIIDNYNYDGGCTSGAYLNNRFNNDNYINGFLFFDDCYCNTYMGLAHKPEYLDNLERFINENSDEKISFLDWIDDKEVKILNIKIDIENFCFGRLQEKNANGKTKEIISTALQYLYYKDPTYGNTYSSYTPVHCCNNITIPFEDITVIDY